MMDAAYARQSGDALIIRELEGRLAREPELARARGFAEGWVCARIRPDWEPPRSEVDEALRLAGFSDAEAVRRDAWASPPRARHDRARGSC